MTGYLEKLTFYKKMKTFYILTHPEYGTYYATTPYKAADTIGITKSYIYPILKSTCRANGWTIGTISNIDDIKWKYVDKTYNEIISHKIKAKMNVTGTQSNGLKLY